MTYYLPRIGLFISKSLQGSVLIKQNSNSGLTWCQLRRLANDSSKDDERSVVRLDYFSNIENRTKDTYLEMVNIYKSKERLRRGHVEFIYSALKHMKDFGVEKDIEVYKSLIDVFPRGKMIPKNIFQVEFMHYPKHQQCAIDLLEQMEENGVIPDWDMEQQLVNVFGSKGYPVRRYWRMMYWMPKWKNASPFQLPRPLPTDSLQLAKLAIKRITDVDPNSKISVFKSSSVEASLDDTWIVSGQSQDQIDIINNLPETSTLYIEGEFRIWLRNVPISYFTLTSDPQPMPSQPIDEQDRLHIVGVWSKPEESLIKPSSVHYQEDGTILAVCATGSSSKDSLLSWIRCLQENNPRLLTMPVLFRLSSGSVNNERDQQAALNQPKQALPPSQF